MKDSIYDRYVAFTKRGRGGKKKQAHGAYLFHQPDGAIRLEVYGVTTCLLTPDNVFTLVAEYKDMRSIGTTSKTTLFINDGNWHGLIQIWLDATRHRGKKVTTRVWQRGDHAFRWPKYECENKDTLPYTKGLQIKDGQVINPEIAVDEVKTLDKEKALEIKRRLARITKLAKGMHRLGVPVDFEGCSRWKVRMDFKIEDVNIDNPTAKDAEKVMALGAAYTSFWHWGNTTPEDRLKAEKRAVRNGLAKLREKLYNEAGLYTYQTKTD